MSKDTRIINSTVELEKLCKIFSKAPYVTLDTEFIREKTYYPQLCLIQMAGPEHAVAIDPLAKDLDLSPLLELLGNKSLTKVFHAARQDIEIFYHLTKKVPLGVFDTQVAAMVCGYGESVGYEPLVSKLIGASIDKSMRFTDWARRPLSEKQIEYAISDVIHLRPVYEKLVSQIESSGRMQWIEEEMQAIYDISRYETNPEEAWRRLKYRSRSPKFLAMLREVAKWREEEAKKQNVPRGRILKDEILVEVAAAAPRTPEELQKVRGFPGMPAKKIKSLLEVMETARQLPPESYPRVEHKKPLPEGTNAVIELLKVLLKAKCEEQGVAQKLVATKEDLEAIAMNSSENVPAMSGWRYTMFGQYAQALMQGKLALAMDSKNSGISLKPIA